MKPHTQSAKLLKARFKPIQRFFDSVLERSKPHLGKHSNSEMSLDGDFSESESRTLLERLIAKIEECGHHSPYLKGPYRLLTARFNRRNAAFMVALCVPALLLTALFTLPGFLFNTPQHNEYFEFAKQLNHGSDRWVAMGLSACCTFFCFAVPCEDYPDQESGEA